MRKIICPSLKCLKSTKKCGSCSLKSRYGQFFPTCKNPRLTIHQVLEIHSSEWRNGPLRGHYFSTFWKLKRSRKALYSSFHIPQQWTFQVEEKQKVRRVRCGAWLAFNSPVLGHLALENVSIQRPNHGTISLARLSNKILRKSVTGTHLDLDQLWSNMTRIQVGLWFLIPLMACLCFAKEEVRDGKLCKFCDCLHVFC